MRIGEVIRGKYKLLRLLGDGGMGTVYEASHELLGTRVAIKLLHAELARRTGLVERFLQEARVAAQIKSPNVVQVTDMDKTPEGTAYIVMELLEGEPLGATMDRVGKLPLGQAVEMTRQMLAALEAAHALGVVHRDLKPENVFLTYQGGKPVLKLIDFGIAKLRSTTQAGRSLTVAGALMGTAEYMAPEQAHSADRADARSDLYAVGVMLYEMLAGKRPVAGEDARTIAVKVERGEVIPLVHAAPEVPREIAGFVHRAMAASPALRFQSATEMRLALDGALAGKSAPGHKTATVALEPARSEGPATVPARPATAILQTGARATPIVEQAPRTERAGPSPIAFGAVPTAAAGTQHGAYGGPSGGNAPRKRRGTWALLALPLLVGAGVVAVVVLQSSDAPSPSPLVVPSAPPPIDLTASAHPPGAPSSAPPSTPGAVTPLDPSPPRAGPGPSHPSDPGHGAHPAPSASNGAPTDPVFVPSLPTAFPLPFPGMGDAGAPMIPFPLPSAFPTAFPSTLPFPLPFPTAAPAPTASDAPSKSGPRSI